MHELRPFRNVEQASRSAFVCVLVKKRGPKYGLWVSKRVGAVIGWKRAGWGSGKGGAGASHVIFKSVHVDRTGGGCAEMDNPRHDRLVMGCLVGLSAAVALSQTRTRWVLPASSAALTSSGWLKCSPWVQVWERERGGLFSGLIHPLLSYSNMVL